jgi:cytidine deaminase
MTQIKSKPFLREEVPFSPDVVKTAVAMAQQARRRAYARYSNYNVGCAVYAQNADGLWAYFSGCNIENASYGLTICAERVAIFKAVSEGFTNIGMMAIATKNAGMSCGACRQVEYEFNPNMYIICVGERGGDVMDYKLGNELPNAFGPHHLEKE